MDLAPILQGGIALIVTLVVIGYVFYMAGLIKVLKRLNRLTWQAFVPILNYYALVRAMGAPKRWFFMAFIPYVGFAYVGTVAVRLGAVFGKGPAFSLFWLTFGAFAGMPIVARSPTLDTDLFHQPIKLLDVRSVRRRLRHTNE